MGLRVDMTGNMTGFTHMLNSARTQAKAFSNSVSTEISQSFIQGFKGAVTGMLTFQGISSAVSGVIGQVNTLRNQMDQIGTGDVEGIQKWGLAFERAGGSVETMTRILGQFQEKREAAMGHDIAAVSARQQLESMGFSAAEINPASGLDPLAFMHRAFNFANANAGNSAFFSSMFGPRTTRFAAASNYFGEQQAPIDKKTYDELNNSEAGLDKFTKALERTAAKLLLVPLADTLTDLPKHPLGFKKWSWRDMFWGGAGKVSDWLFQPDRFPALPIPPGAIHPKGQLPSGAGQQYAEPAGPPAPGDSDAQNLMDEWKQEGDAALESLHRIQDAHISIGDRLKDIDQDLATAHQNTAKIQGKLNSPTLGLSATAFSQMSDIEKQKLRHDLTMQLMGSQSREAELKNEKYQAPLSFQGDSLARVGLYTASALQFNPVLGIQQKQLQTLEKIASNTTPGNSLTSNPHRR